MVFARAPISGLAKTRLIPALGEEGAASLHARLIHRTLETVTVLKNIQAELWCTPDTEHDFFISCAETYGVTLHKQFGNDLGERMNNAFIEALGSAPWAVLIGTDCPELSVADLEMAINILGGDKDAVLGPASDGGYVLIGLSKPAPDLFTNILWGTSQVANVTCERMPKLGLRWSELPMRNDIDRPEDLAQLNIWL